MVNYKGKSYKTHCKVTFSNYNNILRVFIHIVYNKHSSNYKLLKA